MMDFFQIWAVRGTLGTNMSPEMTKTNRKLMYDDKSGQRQGTESAAARLLPDMEDAKMEVGLFFVDITNHHLHILSHMLRPVTVSKAVDKKADAGRDLGLLSGL